MTRFYGVPINAMEKMGRRKSIRFAPRAEEDLVEISIYYLRKASAEAADRIVRGIYDAAVRLGEYPHIGRDRYDIRPGLYSLNVHPYLILYRFDSHRIQISRVLHQKRNVRRIICGEKM